MDTGQITDRRNGRPKILKFPWKKRTYGNHRIVCPYSANGSTCDSEVETALSQIPIDV